MHPLILANEHMGQYSFITLEYNINEINNVWLSSDLHFFHRNVISYCNRPFADVEEMNWKLINIFNELVQPDQDLILLGDLCFGGKQRWASTVARLNGKKKMIKGNHDGINATPLREFGIESALYGCIIIVDDDYQELYNFALSHYPYQYTGDHTDVERYTERRLIDSGGWLLHGHVHTLWQTKGRMINVGVDMWDMKPVSLAQIVKIVDEAQNV